MGLSDVESLIRAASSTVLVIYNDAAHSAEIHQYGSQGLTEKPMLIPEVDFSGVAREFGAESAIFRSLADLPRSRTGSTLAPRAPSWPTAGSPRASGPPG